MSKTTAPATPAPEELELPYTHQFRKPFKFGTETHTEVVLEHELTGGDILDAMNEKREGDRVLRLLSALTGWPDPKVKAIPAREFLALGELVGRFLPSGLPTGN